jgi:hypothetical protein
MKFQIAKFFENYRGVEKERNQNKPVIKKIYIFIKKINKFF